MKKIICSAVFVMMLMFILCFGVSAESYGGECGANGDNVTWNYDVKTGVMKISGQGEMYGNYGSPWFSYDFDIKKVVIEKGVTSIGNEAFSGYSNLYSVIIPNSVTRIGVGAFCGCRELKSIEIPDSVTIIGHEAFKYCEGLTSITIPESVINIGYLSFDETSIKKVIYKGSRADWDAIIIGGGNFIGATEHFDGCNGTYNLESTVNATCALTGTKTFVCFCGDKYTETIKATGKHIGGTATCTVKAKCTVCEQYYGKLKDHTYNSTTTKATLKKNGKITEKCTACGTAKHTTIYYPKSIKLSTTTYTYNGKTKTPTVTVKDSKGKTLKKGTDYTVTYPKKRKSIGKYTVTVTFKGKYSGTKKLTYEIVPAKVTLSKVSADSKQLTATWKTVSGVTGYEVVYSTSKKFTSKTTKKVTIQKAKTKKTTIKKLKKGKKYYVKVRAYKTVSGKKIYGAYSSVKSVKVK